MQNKANSQKAQMNVSPVSTMDYEKKTPGESGKNKPKTNPKQTQTNPIYEKRKMNVNKVLTKNYENIAINIEDPAFRERNTNPIKPNFKGKKCCCV